MDVARLSQLRPRGVWDLADDAFDLYRERFATLAGLSAVAFVPAHLLNTLISTLAYQRLLAARGDEDPSGAAVPLLIYIGAILAGLPVLLLAESIQTAATARAVERRLTGESLAGALVWRDLRRRLVPICAAGLLSAFGMVLATGVSCGLAWPLLSPLWCFVPIAVALEDRSPVASFRRSVALASPRFWHVLGLLAVLALLEFGLQAGLSGLFQLAVSLIPGGAEKADSSVTFVGTQGAAAVAALFLSPLKAVAVTLAYFDLRVRTEALDLVALAEETGVALAEAPQ